MSPLFYISCIFMCSSCYLLHYHRHLRLASVVHACTCWTVLHTRHLHLTQSKAHSQCKLNSTKFFFTHSSQVFLPLPLSLTPLTSKLLHAETQSSLSFLSTYQTTAVFFVLPQCNAFNTKPPQSSSSYHIVMHSIPNHRSLLRLTTL